MLQGCFFVQFHVVSCILNGSTLFRRGGSVVDIDGRRDPHQPGIETGGVLKESATSSRASFRERMQTMSTIAEVAFSEARQNQVVPGVLGIFQKIQRVSQLPLHRDEMMLSSAQAQGMSLLVQDTNALRRSSMSTAEALGPDRRRRSWVAYARWSCAAYCGTAGGRAPAL